MNMYEGISGEKENVILDCGQTAVDRLPGILLERAAR
jgi:hypothetical protein